MSMASLQLACLVSTVVSASLLSSRPAMLQSLVCHAQQTHVTIASARAHPDLAGGLKSSACV